MEGTTARLAALGAYGACAVFLALYGFLVWLTIPVPTGGMTPALSWVTWISSGVILVLLIAAHLALAAQLMGKANR